MVAGLNRRIFVIASAVAGCSTPVCASGAIRKVEENEPKAQAVGYRHDTAKVDRARYPKHQLTQKCSNCLAYAPAKAGDPWGECDLMSDRLVFHEGWCSSYKPLKAPAKKA